MKIYLLDAWKSKKGDTRIAPDYVEKKLDFKSLQEAEYYLSNKIFNCHGHFYFKSTRENTYIRKTYNQYEIAILSTALPKITQKEIKKLIESYPFLPKYNRLIDYAYNHKTANSRAFSRSSKPSLHCK